MGVDPSRFWDLCPAEIFEAVDAWNEGHEYRRQLIAWHAAMVISGTTGKRVNVKKLLGQKKTSDLPAGVQGALLDEAFRRHKQMTGGEGSAEA